MTENKDRMNSTKIPISFKLNSKSDWNPNKEELGVEYKILERELFNAFERICGQHSPDIVYKLINGNTNNCKIHNKDLANIDWNNIRLLKCFIEDNQLLIKPSDKTKNIVIMNEIDYVREAERQLNDIKYYKKIEMSKQLENTNKITKIIKNLHANQFINTKQKEFMLPPKSLKERHFYILPKTHKPVEEWINNFPPGRPIISNVSSETCNVAKFIDLHLEPISNKHSSYIKNSSELISKIRDLPVSKEAYLITADISSLYTNMRLDLVLDSVQKIFLKHPNPDRPDRDILQLLNVILHNNDFKFNNQNYLQTMGTAMGLSCAPHLANIFLIEFDLLASSFIPKPEFWFRYLDDIFTLMVATMTEIMEFQTYLNSLIPNIKLSFHIDLVSVDFLDITIFKYLNGKGETSLQTKPFFKPTSNLNLLNVSSYHPRHVCPGVLYSQILRFHRLSSFEEDFEAANKKLFGSIKKLGYSYSEMNQCKRLVKFCKSKNTDNKDKNKKILPLTLIHNDLSRKLNQVIKNILLKFPTLQNHKIVTAYSNPPNLTNILIRSCYVPSNK